LKKDEKSEEELKKRHEKEQVLTNALVEKKQKDKEQLQEDLAFLAHNIYLTSLTVHCQKIRVILLDRG